MADAETVINQCQSALRRLPQSRQSRAQASFDNELQLVEDSNGWTTLIAAFELAESLRESATACQVIGAGCSSTLAWLLGLSPVDPLKYGTDRRRFWVTSTGRTAFVMRHDDTTGAKPSSTKILHVSPMTPMQAVVARLAKEFPEAPIDDPDRATLKLLATGQVENQFSIPPINDLVSIIRPKRIIELAEIMAINQIRDVSPEHVDDFLAQERPSLSDSKREDRIPCPVLYQEAVIDLLIRCTNLPYRDAYRLLQRGARATAEQAEPLTSEIAAHLSSRLRNPHVARSFADTILKASRVVLCRAHCIGEAITIYRAAYFQAHFESAFNATLKQVAA